MPTYQLSRQREFVEVNKVSVGGVFTNCNSHMYSESPFEKATNRDSKELLSNSKNDDFVPHSFWTFSNATSGAS
jgi:hypothetical protein